MSQSKSYDSTSQRLPYPEFVFVLVQVGYGYTDVIGVFDEDAVQAKCMELQNEHEIKYNIESSQLDVKADPDYPHQLSISFSPGLEFLVTICDTKSGYSQVGQTNTKDVPDEAQRSSGIRS